MFLVRSNCEVVNPRPEFGKDSKKKKVGGGVVKETGDKRRKTGLPQKGREKEENRPPQARGVGNTGRGTRTERGQASTDFPAARRGPSACQS